MSLKRKRAGISSGAVLCEAKKGSERSGLSLSRACGFFALRFQLSELLGGKNAFGAAQESFAALLGAACFQAFSLPRFDFGLLICRQIQGCEINTSNRTTV